MTPRAVRTLEEVDFIAAEDTRVTLKLLNHYGIKKPMVSYFEHNIRERGQYIADRIAAGENCAIVTDAGMPCISDPGEDLVRICGERGIPTVVVPGPSAVVSAVALSGLATSRFTFEGFLSVSRNQRLAHLQELEGERRTMVFYEAPHKLLNTLRDMAEAFGGERRIALCRELTKIHEEVIRTTLDEAWRLFTERPPKGEFVLVIEGRGEEEEEQISLEEAVEQVKEKAAAGKSLSEAAKEVAKATHYKKSELYKAAATCGGASRD
ncbi:16S rRNA (cytidine(1402)-2'-O)-methyltransferase [Oscillospiraceae bacterium NSJ-54]|uniref:16S rRNA (Cytidine(1402)-2'-O)-methyltransferase n=2 Tax=Zongyangia hominis TaxID=2763677 RepID=A0A926ECJ1_9FIRM|nr:16S rRNA (cytidine(1402)-2'-O)-methyltransferase [Zongyangia hominis]